MILMSWTVSSMFIILAFNCNLRACLMTNEFEDPIGKLKTILVVAITSSLSSFQISSKNCLGIRLSMIFDISHQCHTLFSWEEPPGSNTHKISPVIHRKVYPYFPPPWGCRNQRNQVGEEKSKKSSWGREIKEIKGEK